MRVRKKPIQDQQILIRCRHCSKLFRKPVAQDHISRCQDQQNEKAKKSFWWTRQ